MERRPDFRGYLVKKFCQVLALVFCHYVPLVTKSRLIPVIPMDCSLPGSSVHGIFQARILEWAAISSSRGSSRPRDRTCTPCVSFMAGRFFTAEPRGKPVHTGTLPHNCFSGHSGRLVIFSLLTCHLPSPKHHFLWHWVVLISTSPAG